MHLIPGDFIAILIQDFLVKQWKTSWQSTIKENSHENSGAENSIKRPLTHTNFNQPYINPTHSICYPQIYQIQIQ